MDQQIVYYSVWNESCNPPAKLREEKGSSWEYSERIWLRIDAEYQTDKHTGERRMIAPAYTDIGRCVWPKSPKAFHPVPLRNPHSIVSNPATQVEWGTDQYYYEVKGKRVSASYWLPLQHPIPPGEFLPDMVTTGANTYTVLDWESA